MRIYYEGTLANTNSNVHLASIGKLSYPFEVNPSGQDSRLSSMNVVFFNDNNFFEDNLVIPKIHSVYFELKIDGSIIYDGRVQWENVKKENYTKVGAAWEYQKITIPIVDKIDALRFLDMTDIAWSNGDTVYDLLEDMAGACGLTLEVDAFAIEEGNGNSYTIIPGGDDQYRLQTFSETTLLIALKKLCLLFAARAYSYGNKLYFVPLDGLGTLAISSDDVVKYTGAIDYNSVSSVRLLASVDPWTQINKSFTVTKGYRMDLAAQDVEIDLEGYIDKVYITAPVTNQYYPAAPGGLPTSPTTTIINYATGGLFVIESGMILYTDWDGADYAYDSVIQEVNSATQLVFYADGFTPHTGKEFTVDRFGVGGRLHKIDKLMTLISQTYQDYYLPSLFIGKEKFEIHGFKSPVHTYTILSNNYNLYSFELDFKKFRTIVTAKRT